MRYECVTCIVACCLIFGGVVVASWYVPVAVCWFVLCVARWLLCVVLVFGVGCSLFVVGWCVVRCFVFGGGCSWLVVVCSLLFVGSSRVGWRLLFVVGCLAVCWYVFGSCCGFVRVCCLLIVV